MLITIVPSEPSHLSLLSDNIREKDKKECIRLGCQPLHAITQCFKQAVLRSTVLVDGEVAAVFGITGSLFSSQNTLYLITSEVVKKISHITFVRICLQELEKFMMICEKLICYVDVEYKEAIKLLELVGFEREQTLTLNDNKFYLYGITSHGN